MPLQLLGPRALRRHTALVLRLHSAARVFASPCRVMWKFHSRWCIRFSLGCDADEGKYTIIYFQYQEDFGCVCLLGWFSSNDDICPDYYNYSRFKLKDKCRSAKWEVHLYGVMTIKVDRDRVEVLPRGVPPPRFFTQLGNGPHTIYGLCLSERGMGMSMNLADPVSSGMSAGHACPRLQLRYLP